MKTGLIIIILIVVILLFMAAGWYVMNKIDGFMNRTRLDAAAACAAYSRTL